jgi:integrase/recombinase XerD
MRAGKSNCFISYNKLGPFTKLATSYTHTLRHLCLTDLARAGWELHALATFAGHRNLATTLQYIHLSGRDLAEKLTRGMAHIHTWRAQTLAEGPGEGGHC